MDELLKEKRPQEFDTSNLWEDYGLSKNDNRFKNLSIASCGLITKETCAEFRVKAEKFLETLIEGSNQEIADSVLIEAISMLLIGLNGDLFEYDENEMLFYVHKIPICLREFTRNQLLK